jgi:hypothetical protein
MYKLSIFARLCRSCHYLKKISIFILPRSSIEKLECEYVLLLIRFLFFALYEIKIKIPTKKKTINKQAGNLLNIINKFGCKKNDDFIIDIKLTQSTIASSF